MAEIRINRKYKDRLFRLRFGSEEYKEDILSIYNALNGTSYSNVDDISITTIDDVIYIKMKNDVSLLLDGNISLWEQQSSVNPNMPVRGLLYFGNLYDQYIKMNKLNIYGKKLQKIPTPEYIVFYNGEEDYEPVTKLRLSDAFINRNDSGEFEWTATVYNLNKGKNDELLAKCRPLSEYMELVNRIRDNQRSGMSVNDAVDSAVDSCIADGIMSDFLTKHKAEVRNVCITEFDEKVYTDGIREEGRAEGRIEGRKEGRAEGLEQGIKSMIESFKELGVNQESTSIKLKEKFNLDNTQALLYLKKYWI